MDTQYLAHNIISVRLMGKSEVSGRDRTGQGETPDADKLFTSHNEVYEL